MALSELSERCYRTIGHYLSTIGEVLSDYRTGAQSQVARALCARIGTARDRHRRSSPLGSSSYNRAGYTHRHKSLSHIAVIGSQSYISVYKFCLLSRSRYSKILSLAHGGDPAK